jgi:hypothetical protein
VLQFEQSVFDDATGELVSRRRFVATAADSVGPPANGQHAGLNIP